MKITFQYLINSFQLEEPLLNVPQSKDTSSNLKLGWMLGFMKTQISLSRKLSSSMTQSVQIVSMSYQCYQRTASVLNWYLLSSIKLMKIIQFMEVVILPSVNLTQMLSGLSTLLSSSRTAHESTSLQRRVKLRRTCSRLPAA